MIDTRDKAFWWFQLMFWLIAGTTLLISGLTQMPWFTALVRNVFLTMAGFLSSFFLTTLIDRLRHVDELRLRFITMPIAYVVALLCVVAINAITFTQHGIAFANVSVGMWFSGVMNFALVYWFWNELFIQQVYLKGRLAHEPAEQQAAGPDKLVVDDRGSKRRLDVDHISAITAAGDYVEIITAERTFLDRRTIRSLEERLGLSGFLRIHRSAIVNPAQVDQVTPLSRGRFRIQMSDGTVLESSRSHGQAVQQHLLN